VPGVDATMPTSQNSARAFVYRAGVRIAGTVVACDAAAGGDLVFLSHAAVFGAHRRRALPRVGGGRRQILTTEATLRLLGPVGERLRARALLAPFGRPFALGDLRLEIFPAGYQPGAASLLCERGGRRIVYAGPIGPAAEVRAADALCLDARYAARDVAFPPLAAAEESLRRIASDVSGDGAPLLFVEPLALAPLIARMLAAAGFAQRAHRRILDALAAYRQVEPEAPVATVQRFAGRLAKDEVLLWPGDARAPAPGQVRARRSVLVSPRGGSAAGRARLDGPEALLFPFGADAAALARYVEATGARQVALAGAPDDHLAELLRGRGLEAYQIGSPRQIELFTRG
jgi:putative mRNA 3-end processing factor